MVVKIIKLKSSKYSDKGIIVCQDDAGFLFFPPKKAQEIGLTPQENTFCSVDELNLLFDDTFIVIEESNNGTDPT